MNTSNNYDSIERLIYESGLRISSIAFHKLQNMMIVFLSTGTSLFFSISSYRQLFIATEDQLNNYKLISNGVGVHWPELDEDLSLKGFLQEELKKLTGLDDKKPDGSPDKYAMAA